MKTCRAVFDTNVVVSALVFGAGRLAWLRTAWATGHVVPLVSKDTAGELLRVLSYPKFGLTASELEDLLGDYLPIASVADVPDKLPAVPDCRDPFDVPFLRLAVADRADYLVTGARDLLVVKRFESGLILTPEEFRRSLSAVSEEPSRR